MQTIEFHMTEAKDESGELAKYISALIDHDIDFEVRRDAIAVSVRIKGKKCWPK